MNVVPASVAALMLCVSSSLAQVYPPPIVYARTGVSFPSGSDSLSLTFSTYFHLDDAGHAFLSAQVYRNGNTANYEPAILQCDGSSIQAVGDRLNFGGALVPPTSQTASFEYFGASAAGSVFASVSANSEASIVMKSAGSARQAITDFANPAPGVSTLTASRMGIASSAWIAVQGSNNDVWVGDTTQTPVPFTRVLQVNSQAPGLAAGVLLTAPNMLSVNASGSCAMNGGLSGSGITSNTNGQIVMLSQGGNLSIVARNGTPAPGIADGTISRLPLGNQYEYVSLDDTGNITFSATVTSATRGGKAIFSGPPGSVTAVATCGTSLIPGLPGRVTDVRFAGSPNGHIVYWVGINPTGSASGFSNSALITGSTANPQVIARFGQTAPGLPAGTVLWNIREFAVNDQGWVVFRADFSTSAAYPQGGTAFFGWTGGPGITRVLGPNEDVVIDGIPTQIRSNTQPLYFHFNGAGTVAIPVGFQGGVLDGTGGVIGRNIDVAPPPVGFALSGPNANAQSIPVEPTLTWGTSSNADSYSVTITPEGGSALTYSVTSPTFTVPAGVLQGCQNATWGAVAVNASGSTFSTPPTQAFTTASFGCVTPPVYSIQNIGLDDPVYQSIVVTHVTPEGRVAGYNQRYGLGSNIGQDAWIWNGQMSQPLALTGTANEGSGFGGYTKRTSTLTAINSQGKAIGTSLRYASGGAVNAGVDAWYYDGTNPVVRIGMFGPGYDINPTVTVPNHNVSPNGINPSGIVIGSSSRWNAGGSGAYLGVEAWVFDGTSTSVIGLLGPGYQYAASGGTAYDSTAVAINGSGQILGTVTRYTPSGAVLGIETWIKNGSTYDTVLVSGAPYEVTNVTGLLRTVSGQFLNDAGQVAGTVGRRNAAGQFISSDAFFWSGGVLQIIDPSDAIHTNPNTTARAASIKRLGPTGYVVGECNRFAANAGSLGTDVWFFDGTQTRILGLTGPQWQDVPTAPDSTATKISQFIGMNAAGQVLGTTESWANGPSGRPLFGWVFDPATGLTTVLGNVSGPLAVQREMSINDQGAVIGNASIPVSAGGSTTSNTSFIWSPQTGMRTLGSRVLGGLQPQGWNALNNPVGSAGSASHGWSSLIAGSGDYPTSLSRRGFVLTYVPAPGAFPLLSPPDGASVDSPMTTHTWDASPGAASYTVGFTPDGGTTRVVNTASTTISLPASLAAGCERITWTVVANAPTGSTVSTPPTRTFTYFAADYNRNGLINVQDIFDFLGGWFASDPRADFNHNGAINVQDIFEFLAAWFAGCA